MDEIHSIGPVPTSPPYVHALVAGSYRGAELQNAREHITSLLNDFYKNEHEPLHLSVNNIAILSGKQVSGPHNPVSLVFFSGLPVDKLRRITECIQRTHVPSVAVEESFGRDPLQSPTPVYLRRRPLFMRAVYKEPIIPFVNGISAMLVSASLALLAVLAWQRSGHAIGGVVAGTAAALLLTTVILVAIRRTRAASSMDQDRFQFALNDARGMSPSAQVRGELGNFSMMLGCVEWQHGLEHATGGYCPMHGEHGIYRRAPKKLP